VSVLGQPQHDWDEFLDETRKPRKRWRLSRILLVSAAVVLAAAVLVYFYRYWG
jgi:flagellar basal body-associated protein FliL